MLHGDNPGRALKDTIIVSNEHAIADFMAMARSMIDVLGAKGSDITICWRSQPISRIVRNFSERLFGLKSVSSNDVEGATRHAIRKAFARARREGKSVGIHLMGIRLWDEVFEQAKKYQGVRVLAISHTTSDARQLTEIAERQSNPGLPAERRRRPASDRRSALSPRPMAIEEVPENVSLVIPADSGAKLEMELGEFRPSLRTLLGTLEKRLNRSLRHYSFVIYGFGDLIGPAALHAVAELTQRLPKRVFVTDLKFFDEHAQRDPQVRQRIDEVRAQQAEIFDPGSPEDRNRLRGRPLVVLNCTDGKDVLTKEFVLSSTKRLIVGTFGTGPRERAFLDRLVKETNGTCIEGTRLETETVEDLIFGHGRAKIAPSLAPNITYLIPLAGGKTREVTLLAAGQSLTFLDAHPHPNDTSDLHGGLIVGAWIQAHRRFEASRATGRLQGSAAMLEHIVGREDAGPRA